MLKTLTKKNGIASFVEVTMTAIIFIIAAAGILTTIATLQPQSIGSQKRLEAAYTAKSILDELHDDVDATTWDSGDLSVGTHTRTVGNYVISYDVSDVPGLDVRQVQMTITYPD